MRPQRTSDPQARSAADGAAPGIGARRRVGLLLGPAAFVLVLLLPAPAGMSVEAWRTAAIGLLMALWWITEAIPIPATALLPLLLLPLFGIADISAAAAPYANPIIFLFLGGFVLALAMERWGLHRRMALAVVRAIGTRPHSVVLGFMVATAFVSMWVSNTATTVMMLPIGISVVALVRPDTEYGPGQPVDFNFAIALMLGIAYGANVGGLATLIGTPPNALMAGYMLETYGVRIGFARWMVIGVPLVVVLLPLVWIVLTRLVFRIALRELPGGRDAIREQATRLGPVSRGEKTVAAVFTITAALWITRPLLERWLPGLSDTGIAIAAAVALFLIPVDLRRGEFAMDWRTAERLPWGVLLLFGGGLSLADAISRTGLASWIAGELAAVGHWPVVALVLLVVAVIVFLTELTSNTATAAAFLPLVAALAIGVGEDPLLLVVPTAIAASCAFMLPVATPPNAIVYGSGYVTIPQMAKAGVWLNVLCITVITAFAYWAVGVVFG